MAGTSNGISARQFVRAGIVVSILLLSGLLSAAVSISARSRTASTASADVAPAAATAHVFVNKGDTIEPAFSILTDTVLKVTGYHVRVAGTGDSKFIVRLRIRGQVVGVATFELGALPPGVVAPADTVNAPCAMDSTNTGGLTLCGDYWYPWPAITCNVPTSVRYDTTGTVAIPACLDTIASIPKWRTEPCSWIQNSATTIGCFPLGTTRPPAVGAPPDTSAAARARRVQQTLKVEKDDKPKKQKSFNDQLRENPALFQLMRKHPEITPAHPELPLGPDNQINPQTVATPAIPKKPKPPAAATTAAKKKP